MSERISILNEIKSGGYEASLITTFNAYLPFYEDVVLRHLMGSGVRHNVLMMDTSQAALAVERHPPRSAGRLYTLAPISVSGAFHPKIILLLGKKRGTLLIGSHNLTLSGFGYNREMTNLIYYRGSDDIETAGIFSAVWQNVLSWAMTQANPLPKHIIDMINKVQDFAPWLKNADATVSETCRVLSSRQGSANLWQQMVDFAGAAPVKRVIVSGAFFDAKLSFIEKIRNDLSPDELIVGIDPASVQFPVDIKCPGASFVNCSKLGPAEKDGKQTGYLHAKSLLIQREDGECVLAVGSANPSYPAWLAPGITQNIEVMIARKGKDAEEAAAELGLLDIALMSPLTDQEWETARLNWEREEESGQSDSAARIVIAIVTEDRITFKVQHTSLPPELDCDFMTMAGNVVSRQAHLVGGDYVLSYDGTSILGTFFRFTITESRFTGLIQNVKQIEGLSRTGSQRKFNEALASLTTGMPNLEHFVECIKDIIKISDKVAGVKATLIAAHKNPNKTDKEQKDGAELSIALGEVIEREQLQKHRLRGSDDLGYLLDVLLYNLRDEGSSSLDAAMEERDAMGRSEEEQVDADDDDNHLQPQHNITPEKNHPAPSDRNPLDICHYKVGSLVSTACDKLNALKNDGLEYDLSVVIMAGILSALRLLRGLDSKVPWIGAGQTAVPQKELSKLFYKISEVLYDGDKSIICLGGKYSHLTDTDEFARLKGLIIWLAWESGIALKVKKPFNESSEERSFRLSVNRHYVATAQLIAGDDDVISEARQSIGQFSSSDMDWLEKLQSVDRLFRNAYATPDSLQNGAAAKPGDFGFNSLKPDWGVREVLTTDGNNQSLACHGSEHPRFKFPATIIRTIPFERVLNASLLS